MTGKIHSIETFGTVDGPGVRFVVFFQGCTMGCKYCHNPDTWDISSGQEYTPQSLIDKMTRNLPFYKTGGITATGGEPLLQIDFLIELFSLAKGKGIHTCLDTSGLTFNKDNTEKIDILLSLCDLVMLDIKHIDDNEHRCLTKKGNKNILDFARYVSEKGVLLRIRHVLIPEITDKTEYLSRLGEFISTLDTLEKIEVLPLHHLGKTKYEKLGIPYPMKDYPTPSPDQVSNTSKILNSYIKKE
ncbi:MAG: pyruvate formate lyase-activating protein [Clostridia bacterium]|nr:pyruvate formate lyase-activating protein [Clostridia bacterium]